MNTDDTDTLLVEDDPNDATLEQYALRKIVPSPHIHVVTDGAEALDFLFCTGRYAGRDINRPPKLILLDLKLPKVNGYEVLRRIRADQRTHYLPVVILTSSTEERDICESYRLGANSYIQKTVDFDKFTDAMLAIGRYWLVLNVVPSLPDSLPEPAPGGAA